MFVITVPGADYSQSGLGNIDPITNFALKAGLNETQKGYYRTFYNSLVEKDVWRFMEAIYPFQGNTALTQSLNLKNADLNNLVFSNDTAGAHTNAGYVIGSNQYAVSGWRPKTGAINSLGLGIFNTNNVAGSPGLDMQINWEVDPETFHVQVGRAFGTPVSVGNISRDSADWFIEPSGPISGIGLYSVSRVGNAMSILFNKSVGFTKNVNNTPVYTGNGTLRIGKPGETLAFAYVMGEGTTNQKIIDLETAVNNLVSSLGR